MKLIQNQRNPNNGPLMEKGLLVGSVSDTAKKAIEMLPWIGVFCKFTSSLLRALDIYLGFIRYFKVFKNLITNFRLHIIKPKTPHS